MVDIVEAALYTPFQNPIGAELFLLGVIHFAPSIPAVLLPLSWVTRLAANNFA